jgi:hypothetical protein
LEPRLLRACAQRLHGSQSCGASVFHPHLLKAGAQVLFGGRFTHAEDCGHMSTHILILTVISTLLIQSAQTGGLGYQPGDTPKSALERQTNQQVELRLKNGERISGKVSAVSEKTVHLTALTSQEFYEALIGLEDISANVVRAATK